MTSRNFLQRPHRLHRSSPKFHDQLRDILFGEGCEQSVPNLQNDDLVLLVNYLDEVRRHVALPRSLLKQA